MKIFATLALLVSSVSFAQNDWRPILVSIAPEDTFTPTGFDNNDNAQIILSGAYPSTCYKIGPVQVKVDEASKSVLVKNQAYLYGSAWCAFMIVPYTQVVNLGLLNEGNYQVFVEDELGGKRLTGRLGVSASTSTNPDDYLYAPVKEAILGPKGIDGKRQLMLRGTFTTSCMKIDSVKTIYASDKMVEILPITRFEGGNCNDVMVPFELPVSIDTKKLRDGKVLLHVRSLNGGSINSVVDLSIPQ